MAKPQGIHIKQWHSGLHTNRAATSTPIRPTLGGAIPLNDTLWDGLNMEISPANTLVRRPGWPKYCTATYSSDVPKGFAGTVLNGNLFRLLDTDKKVYSFDGSSLTSILTKAANSIQSSFKQVGNMLFFSDGAENKKWAGYADPTALTLATPTNNGIVAPVNAPTITNLNLYDTVGTTQYLHAWIAGYTYSNTTSSPQNYFFLAPTGEVQWAVIAKGTTLTSAKTAPNWATNYGVFGGRTTDGGMLWTNCGPIGTWAANTAFANAGYVATHPLSATSTTATITSTGSASYNWITGITSHNPSGTAVGIFEATPTTGNTNTLKFTGLGFNVPAGATITGIEVDVYRRTNRTNGVNDVTVKLLKAGTPAGSNKATAGFWPVVAPPNVLTINPLVSFPDLNIQGTGGIEQVYGGSTDLWGTTWTPTDVNDANFGIEIIANVASTDWATAGITFVNGNAQTPVTFKVYYIAAASDISGTVYAQVIADSNNNLQRVKTAGTSSGSAPSWSTTIGGTTTDGGVTWECLGTANQLPVLFSWSYGYSYHTADIGSIHTSTLSPRLTISAPIIGNAVTLGGTGSSDTQCDRDDLYRTADGGSLLLYDTSTPNVNGAVTWTDTATDQDLNFLIIGPVANANDPPPTGITLLEYHMGRLWGANGAYLYFSAGPDCINGDGSQAWPPANVFQFPSAITGIAANSNGLLVTTAGDLFVVLGGPQKETFWVQPLLQNKGIISQNCLVQDGDNAFVYTSTRQLFQISSQGINEIGFTVAPTLASNFAPASASLAVHRSGQDQGLFISDGSTHTMRYNLNAQSWDPLATPVAGIGPINSIQTAIGTQTLLSTANGFIVNRDPATFQDSGSSYSGFATVGSLTVSESGQDVGKVENILVTSAAVGTALTVSVLPNEISGSFSSLGTPVADPWQLPASSTLNMKRYDWKNVQTPLANALRHLQVKITLPTEAFKNEIYTLGLV